MRAIDEFQPNRFGLEITFCLLSNTKGSIFLAGSNTHVPLESD